MASNKIKYYVGGMEVMNRRRQEGILKTILINLDYLCGFIAGFGSIYAAMTFWLRMLEWALDESTSLNLDFVTIIGIPLSLFLFAQWVDRISKKTDLILARVITIIFVLYSLNKVIEVFFKK